MSFKLLFSKSLHCRHRGVSEAHVLNFLSTPSGQPAGGDGTSVCRDPAQKVGISVGSGVCYKAYR